MNKKLEAVKAPVASIEDKVKALSVGKTQNIKLTHLDGATTLYEDIAGYSLNAQFVAVLSKDGDTTVFVLNDLKKIEHYNVTAKE